MKVIVDTCVWSLALRKRQQTNDVITDKLKNLIADGRVVLLGTVRQEILSGIKHKEQFEKLRNNLQAFPNLLTDIEDYELAAEYFNVCRRHGIQGSNTDFLMCATANRRNYKIFTTDKDFINFSQYLPILLTQM
ncbi:type II toxin-antitoxin system VapC family toxin [Crocosphaera chwakensis]|uniref:PilT protein-like n=1 Tax=Crocosphaera chwakensis CCY0110 TaxID=391612 RepID=A3IRW4_9CHRO|nr:PIN domain-containing protein [Crocosphaera chwakensis]EAZ90815.1 PilT protein-like [Crocosphaera chwakensis CCY0110]